MARIRWFGNEFEATPLELLESGDWLMKPTGHGPRHTPDTPHIKVKPHEIIELNGLEVAQVTEAESLAALEKAMAVERETLPHPATLLKGVKTIKDQ
jgi:hypothetical protein